MDFMNNQTNDCAWCGEEFTFRKRGAEKKFCGEICRKESLRKYYREQYRNKKGIPLSAISSEVEEIRRKGISDAKRGKKHSPEHNAKVSATMKAQYASGERKPTGGIHDTPEAKERQRQIALKQHRDGQINKSGLAIGQTRTTEERKADWTPEKRAAQALRTTQAYKDGRMQVHGRFRGNWSLYDGPSGQINMRSQSELIFAEKLDRHEIKWEYESRRFDLGWSTYLPDFYLPDYDVWVEVKGHLSKTAKRKIDDFIALGYRLVITTYKEVRAGGLPSELKFAASPDAGILANELSGKAPARGGESVGKQS